MWIHKSHNAGSTVEVFIHTHWTMFV